MCGELKRSGPTTPRIRINADTDEPACIGGAKLATDDDAGRYGPHPVNSLTCCRRHGCIVTELPSLMKRRRREKIRARV
jgi:hypothetical protein